MGLLSKAGNCEGAPDSESAFTEAGQALKERIANLPSKKSTPEPSISDTTAEKEIALFHQTHPEFNCLVLENSPQGSDENFCETVSSIIGSVGTVIPLPSCRPLILLSLSADRELIAHRLAKALGTKILLSFETNTPENVSARITSLL